MGQLALFFALQLLGSWAGLAIGPSRDTGLCTALGFLIGLAVAVFLSLPLLLAGQFNSFTVIAMLVIALAAFVALAVWRQRATLASALRFMAWATIFTVACIPVCAWNLATLTYDSQQFLAYAAQVQTEEQLSLTTLSWLHSWGSFQIVAHSLAVVTGETFLYALSPALSISMLATFAVAIDRGLERLGTSRGTRIISATVALLVLVAIPLVRVHLFYVHANWAAAGYLFVFAALWWLAELTRDPSYLPPALLALLAFSFCRVESPMFSALFLVLVLSQTRLTRSAVFPSYTGFTIALTGWLLLMASLIPDDSEYLTPTRSLMMAGAIGGVFGFFLVRDRLHRLLPAIPVLVAIACVLVAALAAVLRFDAFRISFSGWQADLWFGSYWGYFLWPLVAVLTLWTLREPAPPCSRALRYGIGLFFVLVTLLSSLGDFYSRGRYAGLTRLTLHIVPLMMFYFAIAIAPMVAGRLSPTDTKPREPI